MHAAVRGEVLREACAIKYSRDAFVLFAGAPIPS